MTTTTRQERLAARSLATLLDDTDAVLRHGSRAGAQVWGTGFPVLDDVLTGGFRSGELVLLGGPQGNGKTTLALQFLRNAVLAGGSGIFFSYEHESHTLIERLISMEAAERDPGEVAEVREVRAAFEAGSGGASLAEVLDALPGAPAAYAAMRDYGDRLHVHESSGSKTTLDAIRIAATQVMELTGEAPFVLVDYLQKVPDAAPEENDRITATAEGLKDLALDLGVPVVAISAADKSSLASGHRMRTHDLRGSSALAFEADVVLILNDKVDIVSREHLVYDLGNSARFRDWSIVTLEKNRHGRAHIELEFAKDFDHGRFHTDGSEVRERLIDDRVIIT